MDKLVAIRIKYDDQTYSEQIPVSVLAENVQWDESSTLIDILGNINLTHKGNIQDQIDELDNRISQEAYSKPIDGIPKADLADSVKISLGKADTALQSYTETDPTVPAWAKQPNKPTYTAQEVGALPADSQITVEVDNTLSIQGAAADAKAVGDALDSISTSIQNIWTGRCTDRFPTITENKTVVLDNPEGFSLVNGVVIAIKYIGNSKTVSSPCLNVNGTGNIPVVAGNDSSFGNDKYHLKAWGDQGLHFFMYSALGNNPGKWYLTNVDTKMWINLIDDFSILKDANVATAQDLGKVPTVKVIRGDQVAEWQYKDITIDNTLSVQGAPADAKKVGDELTQIKQDLEIQQSRAETAQALKINKPITDPNGTNGQILQTDGQGGTVWVDKQTDEQIANAVTDWLDDHVVPGASTIVVDDTLSISGAAADAKKTGDELTQLKEDLGLSDYHSLSDGYFNTNGTISSPSADAEKYTSNYIVVISGETLEFSVTLSRTNWQWVRWIFYDKDKSVIGNGTKPSSYVNPMTATINVPENAAFIRFSFRSYNNLKSLTLKRDASIIESLLGVIDNLDESTISVINEGYYSVDWVSNKRISRDDGTEVDDSDYSATGFIAVPPYTKIQIYTGGDNLVWGAVYDSNKDYVESVGWNGEPQERFNNSVNTIYYRTSAYNNNLTGVKVKILPAVDLSLSVIGVPADAKIVGDKFESLNKDSVPLYYKAQLGTKEAIIRGHFDDCAFNGDGLIFITDTHFASDLFTSENPTSYFNANNSFSLIKDIISKCAINKIVFGGDLLNSATDIDTMLMCMASFGNRWGDRQPLLRYCIGNHEYFTGNDYGQTTKPTPSELYGAGVKYNEDIISGKTEMGTFFFDNKIQKIRYFVVSCGRDTELTVSQVAWVLNEFKSIPQDYHVVVIGHAFMTDAMDAFRGYHKNIMDALDAVKAKTTYTFNSVTYDYSNLSNVEVVCAITGHTHIDGYKTTSGGVTCICTTTDSYDLNLELNEGSIVSAPRAKGTTDEQAFDVIQFDFENKEIYCTRIGYGSDRQFSF